MKRSIFPFLTLITCTGICFTGCVDEKSYYKHSMVSGFHSPIVVRKPTTATEMAKWLSDSSNVTWLPRQVSGRVDGATALDNIQQAAAGHAAKMSSYGTAPGGYVRLDPRMLRAMMTLVEEGYRFRVTSIAGASHSRNSLHYQGLAFDVDQINGVKVEYGSPYYHKFMARCRELGATETFGPGSRGHSGHVHAAWPRP